jgi:hypothetical protein
MLPDRATISSDSLVSVGHTRRFKYTHRLHCVFISSCLLAAFLTMAVWIRSFYLTDSLSFLIDPIESLSVTSLPAGIGLYTRSVIPGRYVGHKISTVGQLNSNPKYSFHSCPSEASSLKDSFSWFWFGSDYQQPGSNWPQIRGQGALLPWWSIIICEIAFPFRQAYKAMKVMRRTGSGHCRVCGYDMRGNVFRCSECGSRTK